MKLASEQASNLESPTEWLFNVNVDITVKINDPMARLGVVIRDSNGKVVVAIVQLSRLQNSSANMKAEAMSLGIKTAHNAGYFQWLQDLIRKK